MTRQKTSRASQKYNGAFPVNLPVAPQDSANRVLEEWKLGKVTFFKRKDLKRMLLTITRYLATKHYPEDFQKKGLCLSLPASC